MPRRKRFTQRDGMMTVKAPSPQMEFEMHSTPKTSRLTLPPKEKRMMQGEFNLKIKPRTEPLTRQQAWLPHAVKIMDSAGSVIIELGNAKHPALKYKELLESGRLHAFTNPRERLMMIKAVWNKLPPKQRPKLKPNSTLSEIELALVGKTSVPGELLKEHEQPQLPKMPSPHQLMLEREKLLEKKQKK